MGTLGGPRSPWQQRCGLSPLGRFLCLVFVDLVLPGANLVHPGATTHSPLQKFPLSSTFSTVLPSLFGAPGNIEQLISHVVCPTVTVLRGQVLFTACKLKLFDVLKDQGPLKAVDVARKLDACAGGTEQLLDVCVALGLLEKTHRGEGLPGCLPSSFACETGSPSDSGF